MKKSKLCRFGDCMLPKYPPVKIFSKRLFSLFSFSTKNRSGWYFLWTWLKTYTGKWSRRLCPEERRCTRRDWWSRQSGQSAPLSIGAVEAEDLGEGAGIEPIPAEPE
jgi:hypothetical protein